MNKCVIRFVQPKRKMKTMLVCLLSRMACLPINTSLSIPLAVPECSRLVLSLSSFAVVVAVVVFVIICVGSVKIQVEIGKSWSTSDTDSIISLRFERRRFVRGKYQRCSYANLFSISIML